MLIEASSPLTVRLPSGEVHLTPGKPVELPDEQAKQLLAKVPGKVWAVHPPELIIIEPAHPNARPVFWERNTGEIVGPAQPEFLAKVGEGSNASYWVVAQFEGVPIWINSVVLRSKRDFETQMRLKPVELIREPR